MKNNMTKNTDTSRISKPDDDNAMQDNTVKSNVQNVKNENQIKIFKKTGGEEFPDDSSDLHAAVHRLEGCEDEDFTFAGIRPALPSAKEKSLRRRFRYPKSFPLISVFLLSAILLGCLFCRFLMTKDPSFMDLDNSNLPPSPEFLFGTDLLGRDIFSMIWYGGRISLLIGFLSAAVAAVTAVIFGALSGLAPPWLDALLMRVTELILSIPSLLIILLLQATLGEATILSLSLVIGLTGWPGIAKVVRTEVRQIRSSGYVAAARTMGAGFFHILRKHLTPNFLPSILFMIVMNIRNAITAESTLSFIGVGLPLKMISWGSMLSLSEQAVMTASWWIILIPGFFLVTALLCVTNIGNYLRKNTDKRHSNL